MPAAPLAAFCPPLKRFPISPTIPPLPVWVLPPVLEPNTRPPAPRRRLSIPGANFIAANAAASLPRKDSTCGPLFTR